MRPLTQYQLKLRATKLQKSAKFCINDIFAKVQIRFKRASNLVQNVFWKV